MSSKSVILWVVATRSSFQVDLDWGLYFCPRSRPYEEHQYIGIYHDGAVRALGREQSVVDVELDTASPELVEGVESGAPAVRRSEGAIEDAWKRFGWDLGQWLPKVPRSTERLAVELSGRRWS